MRNFDILALHNVQIYDFLVAVLKFGFYLRRQFAKLAVQVTRGMAPSFQWTLEHMSPIQPQLRVSFHFLYPFSSSNDIGTGPGV